MIRFSQNNTFRKIILVFFLSLVLANFLRLDFNNLSWNNNSAHYLGIIANSLMTIIVKLSLDKKTKNQ